VLAPSVARKPVVVSWGAGACGARRVRGAAGAEAAWVVWFAWAGGCHCKAHVVVGLGVGCHARDNQCAAMPCMHSTANRISPMTRRCFRGAG